MAGRIRDADIALVRERTAIADVISEHVTLKPGGAGNLKGLCPFHDEKTPSFNVSTARNVYYCHGCGGGGDAISFLMQAEHFSFAEAIERLAVKSGVALRYEETPGGGSGPPRKPGLRQRLHAAHQDAAAFYAEQLTSPEARAARQFLDSRGFTKAAAETYGCGFAPDAWDQLTRHLRAKGYTADELVTGGLSKPARSGSLIDRFRRRLMWPIRELAGEVIGFGARKLFDNDDGPKYLNTPETPIYKKSQVLYGIERAKREIAKQGRAVVVEGYTDVMACHLSDVPTTVATCGTAFGAEHIGVLRRLLMDTDEFVGEIIFTFDGDAAGQKAALRAFADDQRFVAQTFIAVSPDNMDPCDLRLSKGEAAVRDLIARRERLIDFALRSMLRRYDLESPEGRVAALRSTAPLVAQIKDRALRPEYARKLAGDLGMEVEPVTRAVSQAMGAASQAMGSEAARSAQRTGAAVAAPGPDSPQSVVEREALKIAVQLPVLAGPLFDAVDATPYLHPVHAAVRQAVADAGGTASGSAGADWVERVRAACPDLAAQALVGELSVEPLRSNAEADPRYLAVTLARLQLPTVNRQIAELKSRVQRVNPVERKDEYLTLAGELFSLEQQARGLKDQAAGAL